MSTPIGYLANLPILEQHAHPQSNAEYGDEEGGHSAVRQELVVGQDLVRCEKAGTRARVNREIIMIGARIQEQDPDVIAEGIYDAQKERYVVHKQASRMCLDPVAVKYKNVPLKRGEGHEH